MADSPRVAGGHLDASGPRQVIYCHQCEHEWYQDQSGLICPRCQGEITEIVTPDSDPRPHIDHDHDHEEPPLGFRGPRWDHQPDLDSDPEEADIEEHITRGPGGSVLFSRTVRTSTPRSAYGNPRRRRDPMDEDPDHVMRDFQNMIGNLVGPGFRPGQAGRSGANTLFTQGSPFGGQTFRAGGNGHGPHVVGGRFTFTTGGGLPGGRFQGLPPRDVDGPQQAGGPPVEDLATYDPLPNPNPLNGRSFHVISIRAPPDQLARLIGSLFGPMGPPGQRDGPHAHGVGGLPGGLQGLFAAMLNPANARSGDAVYTQEALDQIISTLMEQHPTSNAPGPASPDAISALPKKKLDEKELGPEGKGECSVCMDDVTLGVEVVVLPCSHWFHEACASAWLSEHNTCPICRKGIEGETSSPTPTPSSRRSSQSGSTSRNEHRARRLSSIRPRMDRFNSASAREARLDSIRNSGRMSPTEEPQSSRRWHHGTDPSAQQAGGSAAADSTSSMPGAFYTRQPEIPEPSYTRRANTSGSDRSRESRRSSHSGNSATGGGAMGWFRNHFGSNRRTE